MLNWEMSTPCWLPRETRTGFSRPNLQVSLRQEQSAQFLKYAQAD